MKIVFRPENFERAYSAIETQISLLNLWVDYHIRADLAERLMPFVSVATKIEDQGE